MNRAKLVFAAGAVILIFIYGFVTAQYRIFPYSAFLLARQAAIDLRSNWRSYAHNTPTRWLAQASTTGAGGVTRWIHGVPQRGWTFVSSLFDGDVALRLIDLDGRVIHTWTIKYLDIWSQTEREEIGVQPFANWDVGVMGAVLLPDGSVIFTFNDGGLVRMDKCGNVVWKRALLTHHSIYKSEDGTFWIPSVANIHAAGSEVNLPLVTPPFREESVIQIDQAGNVLREISIPKLLLRNGLESILFANGVTATTNLTDDYMHLNSVAVLQKRDEHAFQNFRAGDVLVSLRNLNLLLVFDPQSELVKWYQIGPWLRQHDAKFTSDGKISLFDNHTDNADGRVFGGSRILKIDPNSHELRIVYAGSRESPFYSAIEGHHVYLDNGDVLISEAMAGRVFEVDGEGRIVWEFINKFDPNYVVAETHAYARISADVLSQVSWACK